MSNDDKRSVKTGPIIAAGVLLMLGAYVGGYLGLSEFGDAGFSARIFKADWQVIFFKPALMVESRCRGELWAGTVESGLELVD